LQPLQILLRAAQAVEGHHHVVGVGANTDPGGPAGHGGLDQLEHVAVWIGELEVLDLVQGALPVQLEAASLHALCPGAAALQQ